MMNEVDGMRQEDYSKDWDAYRNSERAILRVREEDEGGRVMVMRDDERVRPGD